MEKDAKRRQGRYCSNKCKYEAMRGSQYRGATYRSVRKDGYILVYDYSTGKMRRLLEHRLVMEQELGRPLAHNEQVHHINRDRADNRPENLMVLSPSDHTALHWADVRV